MTDVIRQRVLDELAKSPGVQRKVSMEQTLECPMLICSYKLFEYCLRTYPKRYVHADRHVEFNDFYYFNRRGQVRIVVNKTQLWIEHPTKGWPFILRRRG